MPIKRLHCRIFFLVRIFLVFFIFCFAQGASAQTQSVSGIVRSAADNQPLTGVTVQAKGSSSGTTATDAKGHFVLKDVSASDSIQFTSIGFRNETVGVGNRNRINISLQAESAALDQVVVVGYGTAQKRDLTGSVSRIDMTEKVQNNVNLLQAIQGEIPGLNAMGGGGLAGDEPSISIRGQTSLSASDRPLIVLDNVIFNGAISEINVNDVETIDVLKDASAAAVYGSRSANGVIIITTKKGKTDKPRFNFNSSFGTQNFAKMLPVMNADQYALRLVDYYWEQQLYSWYKSNPTSPAGRPVRPDIRDRNVVATTLRSEEEKNNYLAGGHDINWIDEVSRTSTLQNYDLNVSGRSPKSSYYISGSYTDQKGVLLNDKFNRATVRSNFENKVTDWMTVGLRSSYSTRDYSGLETGLERARFASPLVNMFNANGTYPMYFGTETYQVHPFANLLADNVDIRKNVSVLGTVNIKLPIEGLTYDIRYSNTYNTAKSNTFYPPTIFDGSANNGSGNKNNSEENNWLLDNIVNYSKSFAGHRVSATLLYSRENRKGESSNLSATQFGNYVLGFNAIQLGTLPAVSSTAWEENSIAYMGRLNYVFRNKYMVTGTVRKDGFSGFGASKKYATFPSLSFAWVTSDEGFVKKNVGKWLDLLKLRISYGSNGNQGIGRYSSFSRMSSNDFVFGSTTVIGVIPSTLGNVDLGWETTNALNLGLDYAVLNNRISGSVELYTAKTSNVLVNRTVPYATGYRNVWTNIGQIDNKGIELSLKTINIKGPLQWESRFAYSLNRDKITRLYGGTADKDIGNSWFVGESISALYDYKMTGGLWTEEELYKGQTLAGFYPGQWKLADLNGDGVIDPNNDRSIIGYSSPNYRFSVNNILSYKNFSLNVFVNSVMGGNGYFLRDNSNLLSAATVTDEVQRRNQYIIHQYWTPDNGVNNNPGIFNAPRVVAGLYEDRSFVRLQNVSLSYRFSQNLLKAVKISDLSFFISGRNLYTWTKWSGWDPETASNSMPLMKSIIGGINLTW